MTDNTDSPASNQTHVPIEEYVHLQKKYLESVLTEQSFMIEIKELLDKSVEANARIAELEAALTPLAEMDYWIEPHHDAHDSIEQCNQLTVAEILAARAALSGNK